MPTSCSRCQVKPGTAGRGSMPPHASICLGCAAIETLEIPGTLERKGNVPDLITNGPAWASTQDIRQSAGTESNPEKSMWLHQARALQELADGKNVGVATATASGKSRVFQLWTLHELMTDPEATALVFYPTKALANDQAYSWNRRCADVGLPGGTVDQINGDVPMKLRDGILNTSRVVIMTPDVCHAWLTRNAETPAVGEFLKGLRVVIIDEAHTYESIFGSNSAYLFRRLITASVTAGNPNPPQYIAATATILEPATHLHRLTGQEFRVIGQEENGAPVSPGLSTIWPTTNRVIGPVPPNRWPNWWSTLSTTTPSPRSSPSTIPGRASSGLSRTSDVRTSSCPTGPVTSRRTGSR